MINKTIHFIWLGGKKKPDSVLKCIETWRRFTDSSWTIKEWNESNINLDEHPFLREQYNKKNWAFASDYLRGRIVRDNGGFYFDTDIELTSNIDSLLKYDHVFSRNSVSWFTASIFGAKKGSEILNKYVKYYSNEYIANHQPTSGEQLAFAARIEGVKYNYNGTTEKIKNTLVCDEKVLQYKIDKENLAIHHHDGSWFEDRDEEKATKRISKKINTRSDFRKIKKETRTLIRKFKKFQKVLNLDDSWK